MTARWTAKPGEEDAVAAAIRRLIEPSRSEEGNIFYQPHRDPEEARVFYFYEQYVDRAAYEAHGASAHFEAHGFGDAIPRLASRERAFYETWED